MRADAKRFAYTDSFVLPCRAQDARDQYKLRTVVRVEHPFPVRCHYVLFTSAHNARDMHAISFAATQIKAQDDLTGCIQDLKI